MIVEKEIIIKSSGNSSCWICGNFYDKNYNKNKNDVCGECGKFHGLCDVCFDIHSRYARYVPSYGKIEMFYIGEKKILAYYDEDREYVKKLIERKYK